MTKNHFYKTILIVEDNREIGEVIIEVLTEETYHKVYLTTSGLEALQFAKVIRPDLLLLDYQLPSMTGLQLFDRLTDREQYPEIPAIMMSANLPWNELEKRHIIGLEKPFDLDDLAGLVKKMLA